MNPNEPYYDTSVQNGAPKIEKFEVVCKDTGGEWIVNRSDLSPRDARTRMVQIAGVLASEGWTAVGIGRMAIVMEHPENVVLRTHIKIRKVRS